MEGLALAPQRAVGFGGGRNKRGADPWSFLMWKSPGISKALQLRTPPFSSPSRAAPARETGRFERWKRNCELSTFNDRLIDVCTRKRLFLTCFPSPFFSSASSPGREKHNFQRAHYTTLVSFTPSSLTIFMGVAQHVLK